MRVAQERGVTNENMQFGGALVLIVTHIAYLYCCSFITGTLIPTTVILAKARQDAIAERQRTERRSDDELLVPQKAA